MAAPLPDEIAQLALLGWQMAPCPAGRKVPFSEEKLGGGWDEVASAAVADWWRRFPGANFLAVMGPASGVWALDVDGDEGRAALEALIARHGHLPRAPAQRTGGGGLQLFFAWRGAAAERQVPNSASRIGPKIDVRGARRDEAGRWRPGYVVVPPSLHPSGRRYAWAPGRTPWELAPPEAPGWLVEAAVTPKPAKPGGATRSSRPAAPPAGSAPGRRSERYVRAAVENAVGRVLNAATGTRNNTLYANACGLAALVEEGALGGDAAWAALERAALAAGLEASETEKTLTSAFNRKAREAAGLTS